MGHDAHEPIGRSRAAALVLAAIVSVQLGGALAAQLLPRVGVWGSVTLRVGIAALVLLLVTRPRLRGRTGRDWRSVMVLGTSLALMNLTFYASLTRLPLGVAVTVEFLGPLALAAATSRRRGDALVVLAALGGVVLVSRAAHTGAARLDPVGVALALAAGACWAGYILASGSAGRRWQGLDGIALAMIVAALLAAPLGATAAGPALLDPGIVARGTGIAILSSALPYSLELIALRRLTAGVFGILMSLEPAMAALAGVVVLGQNLGPDQILGMGLVVAASIVVMRRAPSGNA